MRTMEDARKEQAEHAERKKRRKRQELWEKAFFAALSGGAGGRSDELANWAVATIEEVRKDANIDDPEP